jgi:hypothetical protein
VKQLLPRFNHIPRCSWIAALMLAGAWRGVAQSPADPRPPITADKISALAHHLLETGLHENALAGDELKPWHMKVEFQLLLPNEKKPSLGTMEEWHLSTDRWMRVFKSSERELTGTEWSISPAEQYQSKLSKVGFQHRQLFLRVARPVTDPLYQAANVQPGYEMDLKRVHTAGLALSCISVVDAKRYGDQANPDWFFPTTCFDDDRHLRLAATSDTSVHFDDLQPFEGRTLARDVRVIVNGSLIAEMKVSLLEELGNPDPTLLKPPHDAVLMAYTIEPGRPKPVSVYEVGASVPLQPNGFPFRGSFPIPITIHKDGTVKARNDDTSLWSQDLKDSLVTAINKWKYKPYLVDGHPVEVAWTVVYVIDGKPFVPSYERTEPQTVPAQQDSAPDGLNPPAHRRWH